MKTHVIAVGCVLAVLCVSLSAQEQAKKSESGPSASAEKKSWLSKLPFTLYGYVKLDASFDSGRVNAGNFARWVESEEDNSEDSQFNMTANQTRLGLKADGPDAGGMKSSATIEVDFYGAGGAENKPNLRMRHAFVTLDWPEKDFNIIAGQTWDVISPLYPSTVNFTILWWCGNTGYRRPQLRLTKGIRVSDRARLEIAGSISRNIGDANTFGPGDSGEDSAVPCLQGRIGCDIDAWAARPLCLGISSHWGREEYDTSAAGDEEDFNSWSVTLDLNIPITSRFGIKGEVWTGQNMNAYLGCIGQGVNTVTMDEIRSIGGWGAASFGPWNSCTFNAGAGIEDPDNDDLNDGDRSLNQSYFGNIMYQVNKALHLGGEISYWKTDYRAKEDGDSVRFQTAVIFKF